MITILATVFVFGLIVFIHEMGHFVMAKLCRMRVDEFAIGFGPLLASFRRGETLYSIRAIPLGGYNKIAGMDPSEPLDERSFMTKPIWQRFLVIAAGALMNFVLAIVLFFIVFVGYGVQTPVNEPVVGQIIKNSPAVAAHFQSGDRIITIENKPVTEWKDISTGFAPYANQVTSVMVQRDGKQVELTVIPSLSENNRVVIGIYPAMTTQNYSVLESASMAINGTGRIIYGMVEGLGQMITGKQSADVAGPLGVAQMAGQVASVGFSYLLQFTAMLSINLGVLNLLPVPVLDGGYLILLILEGIRGKRLPDRALYYIQMCGLALLVLLFVYATSSDISRLWQ